MKQVGSDARALYSKTMGDSDMRTDFSEARGARRLGLTVKILSRKDRLQVFGIDCTGPFGDGILFKGGEWIPGGEYVQRLRVKNVSPKLKKLKYRCPTTKYFSMAYPEVITLSPGTVKEVDVVFRPKLCEVYDDVILFKALDGPNAGGFNVPVRALLPTLQVTIPEGLDFGYCQTGDVSERVFHVKNTGEVPAPFLWDVPPPFTISPSEGIAAIGESKAATCFVKPVDASVFVSQAVLKVGDGVNAIKPMPLLEMKVSAVGKYCYVVPSEQELDFGNQTIIALGVGPGDNQGGCPRQDFTLRNQSVVPASFMIRRVEGDRDAVFSLNPSEGIIPPEDDTLITVTYSPTSAGTFSRDHYEVATVGGNKVTIGIQGRAVGCSVRLRKKEDPFQKGYGVPDSVNFREVKIGLTTTRVVYLLNESSTPCRFCFAIQGDASIFRFSSTKGIIPSSGSEHPGEAQITLTFTPMKPTNYYRRIFCLLENQQPLLLDAIGTGYVVAKGEVQEQRPAPLRHAHVQAFRNREDMGLGRCSPRELEKLLESEGMSDLFAKVGPEGTLPLQRCKVARALTRSGEASRVQTAVAAEFFADPTDPNFNPVYLEHSNMNFGFTQAGAEQITTLTNNSNTDVHIVWNLRSSTEDIMCSGLQIIPLEAHVPAGEIFSFRVCFAPTKSNCYFAEDAEAFVSPANQMNFRMVKDATQQPPWCLPLRVHGHSFIGGQFIAKGSLSTQHAGQKLSFPACHVGDTVYQTIRLSNQGNIPACFSFQPDSTGVFGIKPAAGVIPAGNFQLCLVRFTPIGTGAHHHRLSCMLNNDPGSIHEAELFGQGAMPTIQIIYGEWEEEQEGALSTSATSSGSPTDMERDTIYLRPTCVGLVYSGIFKARSSNETEVKNTSRIPAIFMIEPPKASSGVLRVSPLAGLLLGNQMATVKLTFAPREAKRYHFRLLTQVRSILGNTPHLTDCRQLGTPSPTVVSPGANVTIIGMGERGAVSFYPDTLKYSERLANTPESKELVLENRSACDVTYKLFYVANKEPLSRRSSRESVMSGNGPRGKDRGLRPVAKEKGEAKGRGGPNQVEAFFVDQPEGTLPARSRTRTIATFRPVLEGEYDFGILCQVSTANETGDVNIISPLEVEMAEQGHKARVAAALLNDLGKGGNMHEEFGEGKGLLEAQGNVITGIMPLQCSVKGRASFPTVVFRDVRMTRAGGGDISGASPRNLWSALSLTKINGMLREPLTEEEISFNKQSSPDTSQLPRFDVPFVPAVIGSGAVIVTLQVYNPRFLTTRMTLNLPNTKTVEMETWANEGEPSEEELRQNDIIDRNAFTFTPGPGNVIEVSAGECQRLTISYSADSLFYGGVHDLPMLVRIAEGRQFWLDMKGTTIPPGYPMLYVPTGLERQYVLEPVAVGTPLVEAPMQTTQLLNVGDAAVSYRVDGHAINRANEKQGHGVSVFRLEEKTGTIRGGSSGFLRWRFLPLETKEYVLKVTVLAETRVEKAFEGGPKEQSLEIILRGVGYDPRTRDPHSEKLPHTDLGLVHPSRQLEIPRVQYCVLSVERIRLGRIPQKAVLCRAVSIRNCLVATSIDFSWDPEDAGMENPLQASGVVCIRPLKGTLGAGQSALLQVCISATCGSCFLGQHPIKCIMRPVPPTPAPSSRKPKSQLQSRLEQKRQARARLSDLRIPVVSRPTASRSLHMAEVARDFFKRRLTDNRGILLCPRYPISTVNARVPRVLAEALETVHSRGDIQEGGGMLSSRGSNDHIKGQLEGRSGLDDATRGNKLSEGLGRGASSTNQITSLGNSRGRSKCYSEEQLSVPEDGGACILRLAVEGEVVYYETHQELFGSRVDAHRQNHVSDDINGRDISVRGNDNVTMMDTFFIPRPTEYVADWPGLIAGPRGELEGGYDSSRRDEGESSMHLPTMKRGASDELLARACQDIFAKDVVSRVLKQLMGDVVATDGVRGCFTTLPIKQRVPQFKEVCPVSPLPDRLARVLTPHLQGSFVQRSPPPPPTASAAAVIVLPSIDLYRQRINRNTRLKKKDLILAIRAAGSRALSTKSITESNTEHGQAEKTTRGARCITQQRGALARLAAVVEMCPSREVILADLVSTLDNATIRSLEKWLDRGDLFCQNETRRSNDVETASDGSAALITDGTILVGERSVFQAGSTSGELPDSSTLEVTRTYEENKAAVTIQAQARRLQAIGAMKNAAEERHCRLVDKACMNPEIQRILAAALEGTFFNLMQEAVNGEFNLSKRPTRFAIRNAALRHGRRSTEPAAIRGNVDAVAPETDPSSVAYSSSTREEESTTKAVTTEIEGEVAPAVVESTH